MPRLHLFRIEDATSEDMYNNVYDVIVADGSERKECFNYLLLIARKATNIIVLIHNSELKLQTERFHSTMTDLIVDFPQSRCRTQRVQFAEMHDVNLYKNHPAARSWYSEEDIARMKAATKIEAKVVHMKLMVSASVCSKK